MLRAITLRTRRDLASHIKTSRERLRRDVARHEGDQITNAGVGCELLFTQSSNRSAVAVQHVAALSVTIARPIVARRIGLWHSNQERTVVHVCRKPSARQLAKGAVFCAQREPQLRREQRGICRNLDRGQKHGSIDGVHCRSGSLLRRQIAALRARTGRSIERCSRVRQTGKQKAAHGRRCLPLVGDGIASRSSRRYMRSNTIDCVPAFISERILSPLSCSWG